MNPTLTHWNRLSPKKAAQAILSCNGSLAWAETLAAQRPFTSPEALFLASDIAWNALPAEDQQQAFDSHPRIGEQHAKAATTTSLKWSSTEQSGVAPTDTLATANRAYETKFGRIFLICATGRSVTEILAELYRRMRNDPANELLEAADQQRQITQLRLRKWLDIPS